MDFSSTSSDTVISTTTSAYSNLTIDAVTNEIKPRKKKGINYADSSDEDEDKKWNVNDDADPLINAITFGWTEDGRLGSIDPNSQKTLTNPKPIVTIRPSKYAKKLNQKYFICKSASAGSRHTLFLMINCRKEEDSQKRSKKLMLTGLNQLALCEESGYPIPTDVEWNNEMDPPKNICSGNGNCFFVTRRGYVVSFGHGRYGILGHGNCDSVVIPKRIRYLSSIPIRKVATGASHALALADNNTLYGWGRNHLGQLGRGFESPMELRPEIIVFPTLQHSKYKILDLDCGQQHTICLIAVTGRGNVDTNIVYGWGDISRGQLGPVDAENRCKPQENYWLTKYLRNRNLAINQICAGGYHNLAVTKSGGYVVAWGAGDYGQLGSGYQWDDATPKMINQLKSVVAISAGLRHSVAISDIYGEGIFVFGWGYNGYGELGLGDTDIRLQPTKITALQNTRVLRVSCGDRHTVLITSPRPIRAREDSSLKPYFKILESEKGNEALVKKLKWNMKKVGINPSLLDNPDAILPNQAGSVDEEIQNDSFEKGLRYCLDTFSDPLDWRRNAYEVCYDCRTPTIHLKSICLSCARNCQSARKLQPYVRSRGAKSSKCDCIMSGECVCRWSPIRAEFDKLADHENCISPNQLRGLMKTLRQPYPIDGADMESALLVLANGAQEDQLEPKIMPVPFENWYRKYFDETVAPS